MNNECVLSVVVPVYNAESTVASAIDSVLMQRVSGVEVVAVDDGSVDHSADILKSYGSAIKCVFQSNRGASAARNAGIERSNGRFVKFLDADDYLLPFSLHTQIKHALELPDRCISYGRMISWCEKSGLMVGHSARDRRVDNQDSIDNLFLSAPVTASLIYPREIVEALGGFDERVALMDDFDLFARSIVWGCRVIACHNPIYVYRQYRSKERVSSRSSVDDYRSLVAMFERLKSTFDENLFLRDRDKIARGLSRLIWIKARTALQIGYTIEARKLFDIALSINKDCVMGRPIYRALTRLLGPFAAEEVLERVKMIRYK